MESKKEEIIDSFDIAPVLTKNQKILRAIVLNFLILLSLFHLYGCWYSVSIIRMPTKVMLMPTLYFLYMQNTNPKMRSKSYLYGIFLGWIGDTFLLGTNKIMIMLGIICFFSGHIFYIICMFRKIGKKEFELKTRIFLINFGICFLISIYQNKKHVKNWSVPPELYLFIYGYYGILCTINSVSWLMFFFNKNRFTLSVALGAVLFWFSDFYVARNMFDRSYTQGNFIVMLTYIIAQCLICYGLHRIQ